MLIIYKQSIIWICATNRGTGALNCPVLIAPEEDGYSCLVYKWKWTESLAVAHWFVLIAWVTLYGHQGSDCQMSPQYASSNHLFTPHCLMKWKVFFQLIILLMQTIQHREQCHDCNWILMRGGAIGNCPVINVPSVTKLQNTCHVMLQWIRDTNRQVQGDTRCVASINNLSVLE